MLEKRLMQLENAYQRLKEAIEKEKDLLFKNEHQILRDSIIQRLEFTFEVCWKLLKLYLEENGIICYSPRECIKESFKAGLIKDEEKWLEVLKARNLTTHIYNEELAEEIYNQIKKLHFIFHNLIDVIKNKLKTMNQKS